LTVTLAATAAAQAPQPSIDITGDRLSGVVLPVEPVAGNITIEAIRAAAWTVDDTKRLWLGGDVRISVAQFTFAADEAAIWINRIPSAGGTINQIALYFDEVSDPTRRAGMGATGNRLLVTGSTRGDVQLTATIMNETRASGRDVIKHGESRLADYIKSLLATPPALETHPQVEPPKGADEEIELVVGGPPPVEQVDLPETLDLPPQDVSTAPLFLPTGQVAFNAGQVEIQPGERENVIVATDSVIVNYYDDRGQGDISRLNLSAERGVFFTQPGAISDLPSMALDAAFVIGIYLEGNVLATDGSYTIRGTRVYYDFQNQRAIMLDGVIRTYSRDVSRPIYARAEEFRQIAKNQWTAQKAIASTSEFFTPHLAIGARDVTITQKPAGGASAPGAPAPSPGIAPELGPGESGQGGGAGAGGSGSESDSPAASNTITYVEATNNTIELGGIPVFWFPYFAGDVTNIPIKSASASVEDNKGLVIETAWDAFALFGKQAPDGLDLLLHADGFTDRGFGGGVEFRYELTDMSGLVDLYGQVDDGIDKTSTGREVDSMEDFRGVALLEHQMALTSSLDLQLQGSYISDETYITTWREEDFEERREYENSIYLRNVDDNTAWTALLDFHFQDFISNSWLLASRQYTVDRVPEFTYRRYGDSIFSDLLTYSSEYRASRVRIHFEENSPNELGIRARAFGLMGETDFEDALRARGLQQMFVNRFDTRHEIALPFDAGPIRTRPFLVGRFTAYDQGFDSYSTDSDSTRFFGAAGVTFSTEIQRVFDDVDSHILDIHRLRHIVEPSVTLWYGYSNVDQSDLPIYDEDVESLASGAAVRFGLKNTLQTYRGGPGFWRTVDFLTLDTALVLTSSDTDLEHPVPQYFEFRPEYSILADHVSNRLVWLVSDSLSIVGESIYDLDETRMARGSIGAMIQHSPALTTYAEFRYLDATDTQLLELGLIYQLTPKYRISLRPQWDFRFDEFRSLRVQFIRSFPDFDFTFGVTHDSIQNETRFAASVDLHQF